MLSDQTQLFSWFTEPKNEFSSRFSESGCHLVPEKKICSCQTTALVHSCARRPGSRSQRSAPKFLPKGILIRLNPEHPAVLSTQTMDPEALIAAENGGIVPDNPSQDAGIKDQPGQKKMVLDLDAIMVIFLARL